MQKRLEPHGLPSLGRSTTPNIDQIKNFSVLDDAIQLANAIFKSFGTKMGVIGTGNLKANLTGLATDSNDYIIYETDTGMLFYAPMEVPRGDVCRLPYWVPTWP